MRNFSLATLAPPPPPSFRLTVMADRSNEILRSESVQLKHRRYFCYHSWFDILARSDLNTLLCPYVRYNRYLNINIRISKVYCWFNFRVCCIFFLFKIQFCWLCSFSYNDGYCPYVFLCILGILFQIVDDESFQFKKYSWERHFIWIHFMFDWLVSMGQPISLLSLQNDPFKGHKML